jgi:glyoxylase-like metal-dependent hydrolase (beta-lactamase superfamily II)
MPARFEILRMGPDKNLAYLFGDETTGEYAAVDPGFEPDKHLHAVQALGGRIVLILATHSHRDHIAGLDDLKRATGAPLAAHPDFPGVDRPLADGETFQVGSIPCHAWHHPGHCADSILIEIENRKLIVGDELFIGGVGRTHNEAQARVHYNSLHRRLLTLPDHLELHPGHDYGATPTSTLGEQRRSNPYLLQPDFDSFWWLRQNWKTYCQQHGIRWG